ncbi:MAG: hypothetical protein WBQ45_06430 [Roseiarcus sp.]|uniref:hypothetical protein n=1 Tax=Roseiarcus sp. TaxID=1969460 RepID=UPI003C602B30
MGSRKQSAQEIIARLQVVETLTSEGLPLADAIRSAGMLQLEYDRWRLEYNGLVRALGPLLRPTPRLSKKKARRAAPARPAKARPLSDS